MSRSTLLYINGLTVEVCIHRLRLKLDNVNLGDLEISRSAFLGKTTHGLLGGYRAMYQDYTDGSGDNKFEWNVTLHGPILGLGIEFSWFNYKKIMWHPAYAIHCRSSIGLYAPGPTNPDWPLRTN